jgi:hypothetical protein
MPWQKAPKYNYPTPKSHYPAPNVITRLVRVIQGYGKAKKVGSWIPRINPAYFSGINRGMTKRFEANRYCNKTN